MSESANDNEEVEPVQPFQLWKIASHTEYTYPARCNRAIPEKFKQGWLRTYFLEKSLEFLGLLLYP